MTFTPPTSAEIFKGMMENYREQMKKRNTSSFLYKEEVFVYPIYDYLCYHEVKCIKGGIKFETISRYVSLYPRTW